MKLWIRSQDKFDLIQTRSLSITKGDYDEIMIFANGIGIGTYKTKAKALKVLDEIQELMRSLCDSDLKIIQFEMPEE